MSWVLATFLFPFFAGAYGAGWVAGRREGRLALIVTAVCLFFLLLRAFFRYFPDVEYALLRFDGYASVRAWWMFPFALAILGVGTRRMGTRNARIGVAVMAGVLFVRVSILLQASAGFAASDLEGKPDEHGVCRQTSSYSCGAAAAATQLARMGIPADEREMAKRCGTNRFTGTDEFAVCRGLRGKLAEHGGGRVDVVRSDWEGLRRTRLPAMATVRFGFMVDHWLVVLEVEGDEVLLGDPARGRIVQSKERFLEGWRGVLVTVDR